MFILKHCLKNNQRCINKELSTRTNYRHTGHSSRESDVLPVITLELAHLLQGEKPEQKKNETSFSVSFQKIMKFFSNQNYQHSLLSWGLCLNKVSSTNYRSTFNWPHSFICWCTEDTRSYICDHGFHKSEFMMKLTIAFHCIIPAVSYVLFNYDVWTVTWPTSLQHWLCSL